MAIFVTTHRHILSRHATTPSNHDTETSPPLTLLTLEAWMTTSGFIEALSSLHGNVRVKFEREIMEEYDIDRKLFPPCTIRLCVRSKCDDYSIDVLDQFWNLVSLDYTETEIWQALSSSIQKLCLTCLPELLLGRLSNLEHLELEGSSTGQEFFTNEANLQNLNAEGNPTEQSLFTREEMPLLVDLLESPSSRLKSLNCSSCHFGPDVVHSFFQAIAANQTLHQATLEYCNLVGGSFEGNKVVGTESCSNKLRVLRTDECTLDDGAMDALAEMLRSSPSLEQVSFLDTNAPLSAGRLIAQSLVDHCKLESLDLSGLEVDEDGLEAIVDLVKASNGMKSLSLSKLSQVIDISSLADALVSNKTLIQLDLSLNHLSHGGGLSKALQTNQTLQQLDLTRATWEEVDDSTEPSFYTFLGACHGLLHLDLSGMYLSPRDISELAASLRENNSLERLLLNFLDRTAGPVQLESVFDALRANTHLRFLELSRNGLTQHEIQALVESLFVNKSLESLRLSGCDLTDDVIVQLSQSLAKSSLKDFDISCNDFGRGGATAILEMLPKNSTLRSLSLYNSCWSTGGPTHFNCEGFEDINQAIQECLDRRNG